jgi:hypothetical protein
VGENQQAALDHARQYLDAATVKLAKYVEARQRMK